MKKFKGNFRLNCARGNHLKEPSTKSDGLIPHVHQY